ncbi:MAG TPA: MFS transporter, partial [Actinomycetota bacterium]|nr:MFS transporter [Actinomycetota bacterium]
DVRSRVTGAFQAVNYGTRPLGALLGGFLGSPWLLGPRVTLWVAAIGGMTSFLVLLPTQIPRFRMPAASGGRETPALPDAQDLANSAA